MEETMNESTSKSTSKSRGVEEQIWRMRGIPHVPAPDLLEVEDEMAGPGMSCSGLWTVLDALGLMVVLIIQGSLLNYYIILYNEGKAGWYFWFLVDFMVLITFMFSVTFAWRYYQRLGREQGVLKSPFKERNVERPKRFGKGLFKFTFPKPMGMLPLIYLCWFAYAFVLVVKMYILIIMDVPGNMVKDKTQNGAEILAICFAGASIVFLLWLEAHRNMENQRQRRLSKACLDDLITHTVFEIFDSVVFLDLIIPENEAELASDELNVTYSYKMFILFLASINFLTPTLGLYRLSRTHFGGKTGGRLFAINLPVPSSRGLGVSILHHLLRLCAINIPYLIIRIHLSKSVGKELSIFVLKNVLGIWVALRALIPEVKDWMVINEEKKLNRKNANPRFKIDQAEQRAGWELPTIFDKNKTTNNARNDLNKGGGVGGRAKSDHFEEVNLNSTTADTISGDTLNDEVADNSGYRF